MNGRKRGSCFGAAVVSLTQLCGLSSGSPPSDPPQKVLRAAAQMGGNIINVVLKRQVLQGTQETDEREASLAQAKQKLQSSLLMLPKSPTWGWEQG